MSLTGRFSFRKTLTGKIVLQVEEDVRSWLRVFGKRASRRRWRDANTMDLAAPELRALIDLRQKPHFVAQSYGAAGEVAAPDPSVVVELSDANGAIRARR
jgi:hypothetical protein